MTKQTTARPELLLVHSDEYGNWVFEEGHPTQGRRFIHARDRLLTLAHECGVSVREVDSALLPEVTDLETVHDPEYVEAVVHDGRCDEWSGSRMELSRLALRMVGGTILALDALLDGSADTAVHFAGAKHHAQRDRSSGFCVFNDFAIAAKRAVLAGKRIAILDVDAHHGDGTETLLLDDDEVLTFSVHDRSIFPGTGLSNDETQHAFNVALDPGSGDGELQSAVSVFVDHARRFEPSLLFIAMGSDGHVSDPLSTLEYSISGMVTAVSCVRSGFPDTPILLGGAGGYQPDDVTPEAWARMSIAAVAT